MKRLVLLTICAFALLTMASFAPQAVEESTVTVTAYSGDTVWQICQDMYDPRDVRSFEEFVYDVRVANNLTGANVLQAGQELRVTKKVKK